MKNDLVISGFAGRFVQADNLDELAINLYDKKYLITEDDIRWPKGIFGLPLASGKIKNLTHFDSEYFGVKEQLANSLDPQIRILLELVFEALCDSGTNPDDLRGKNIGVFVAADISETEHANLNKKRITGLSLSGTYKTQLANKISYYYDLKGPSYVVTSGCSSGAVALQQAVLNIETGQCDAAIVAGSHLNLNPLYALSYNELKVLSPDGKGKFLDESANGFVRSEAICVMVVENKDQAKRIYAKITGVMTNNDGYRMPPFRPSPQDQANLILKTMEQAGIYQDDIVYIEAHGAGTYKGDQCEVMAIDKALCQGRKDRLMIGGVKTNLGHSEPASAMCQIAKVLLTFENGIIPPSLHLSKFNKTIQDIIETKLIPVIEKTTYTGGIAAINTFGLGGTNGTILLEPDNKLEKIEHLANLPLILPLFARCENGIIELLEHFEIQKEKITIDLAKLYCEICNVSKMNYRGFIIKYCDEKESDSQILTFKSFSKRQENGKILFVFPGLFKQQKNNNNNNNIENLMRFEAFENSIMTSKKILRDMNIEFEDLNLEDKLSNVIIYQVIFQLAITDLFKKLNVDIKNSVGYSIGKIACAYNCSLIDHHDALCVASSISNLFKNFKEVNNIITHISDQQLTDINKLISEKLHVEFSAKFSINQIDAKLFTTISYGSNSIINYITKFYYNENKRKINDDDIYENDGKYYIFEISMVNFIDKISLSDKVNDKLDIIRMKVDCSFYYNLLTCLGRLYELNKTVNFKNIYAKDEYPVSRGTPSIHSLIKWDHSRDYFVPSYNDFVGQISKQ